MDEIGSIEAENNGVYIEPFDKGYWMAWQCTGEDGQYNYDARRAIEYFQRKYNRIAKQVAMGKKHDVDGVEVVDMVIPVGQIWVR